MSNVDIFQNVNNRKMCSQCLGICSICSSPNIQCNFAGVKIGRFTFLTVLMYCSFKASFKYCNFFNRLSLSRSVPDLDCKMLVSCDTKANQNRQNHKMIPGIHISFGKHHNIDVHAQVHSGWTNQHQSWTAVFSFNICKDSFA